MGMGEKTFSKDVFVHFVVVFPFNSLGKSSHQSKVVSFPTTGLV